MTEVWGKNPKPKLDDDIQSRADEISGYKEKKDVFFAFVDVLGFQQMYDEHRNDEGREFTKRYERVFGYFSKLMNNAKFMQDSKKNGDIAAAGQTSDSLYFYTDRPDYLLAFIKIYSHFIVYAMSQDVYFRGGIAKGDLFINEPYQFYGDSVIKAYLLEETLAKFPRVAIDQKTYKEISPEMEADCFDQERGRYYIRPFLDTQISDISEHYDPAFQFEEVGEVEFEQIKVNIERNLDKNEFVEGVYLKYYYLKERIDKVKSKTQE